MFQQQRVAVYTQVFAAFSGVYASREDIDDGGKVLLPQSMLQDISTLNLVYPLQFQLSSFKGKTAHCGVLEFVADEGQIVMPQWMMEGLNVQPMEMVTLKTVILPKATYVKLRPQKKAFIELYNPKAVLENKLTGYAALSVGDAVAVAYQGEVYLIDILELKSGANACHAASIVDTELNVDFDRPLDMPASPIETRDSNAGTAFPAAQGVNFAPTTSYAPPSMKGGPGGPGKGPGAPPAKPSFVPFGGSGSSMSGRAPQGPPRTLGGSAPANPASAAAAAAAARQQAKPVEKPAEKPAEDPPADAGFKAFQGAGRSMR
jgi:ubiquitin fusion degradation protein 1